MGFLKMVPTFPFSLTFQVMVSAYMFLCAFQEWSVFGRTVHRGAPLRKNSSYCWYKYVNTTKK